VKPLLPHSRTLVLVVFANIILWPLIGCGSGGVEPIPTQPTPTPTPTPGATFNGKVLAGTLPITGASVQIYAASATSAAASALLTSPLTTDAAGAFTIPAGYACPASTSQLYVVARGGKVATGTTNAAPTNSAIALFTAIGTCGQLTASTQFVINEGTTAAGAWALSQFLSTGGQLHASATNAQGLTNAVATLGSLVNLTTGASPGAAFPSTATSPAARINTLANLLNTCTSAATSSPCTQLFASTTINGSPAPADTLDAAINLVHHPAANVAALYTQSKASTAFSPSLPTAPSDWTLFVNFKDGVMNLPTALGVDSTGSVWVASYFGAASKFSPTGQPVFPKGITGNNLSDSYGLAIDAKDNVWISNEPEGASPGNSITVLNSSGQSVAGTTGYTAGGVFYPVGIAIDPNATAWVVDYGNAHVTLLSSSTGAALSGTSGYTAPSLAFPVVVAVDANHNGWIGDQNDGIVTRISADGKTVLPISCCNAPNGLAIDQLGHVWVANYLGDSISELASDGTIISKGGFTANGTINHPQAIAIDGSGNVWIGNFRTSYLTQLAGASTTTPGQPLSPASGWAPDAKLFGPFALAIDASGNIWVTNAFDNSLTEFIGLATPVKTPLLGPPQAP
jgi:sugar lactone lactonase YvrE